MNNFDPKTGLPISNGQPNNAKIIGYDSQTGAPIYEQQQNPLPNSHQRGIPPQQNKKKTWLPLILTICILVFLLLVLGIIFGLKRFLFTDKAKVFLGVKNTFSTLSESSLNSYLGYSSLLEKIDAGQYSASNQISFDDIEFIGDGEDYYFDDDFDSLIGTNIACMTVLDLPQEKFSYNVEVENPFISSISANIYAYDDKMAFSLNDMFDGYFEITTENFSKEFNSSFLSELMYYEIPNKIDFNIFESMTENSTLNSSLLEKFSEENYNDLISLGEDITVTPMDSIKLSIDSKKVKCKQYNVTIPTEACIDLLASFYDVAEDEYPAIFDSISNDVSFENDDIDELVDDLKEEFEDDIELHIALYKNKMVYCELDEYHIEDEDIDASMEFSFLGKKSPLDNVTGYITLYDDFGGIDCDFSTTNTASKNSSTRITEIYFDNSYDEEITITCESNLDTKTGEFFVDSLFDFYDGHDDILLSNTFAGNFSDLQKGKAFLCNIDELSLECLDSDKDGFTLYFSGGLGIDTNNFDVESPSGECYDLLSMSESDYEDFLDDNYNDLEELTTTFDFIESILYNLF